MKPLLIYCYDAYCGWCYGFSPVIRKISQEYRSSLDSEALSGGMILPQTPTSISTMAPYIRTAYKTVEDRTGIKFGDDYLWHIFNDEESDWYPNSLMPAVAMCIFKEYMPDLSIEFAADLQFSHHFEGRDLTDPESYRHLTSKYSLPEEEFLKMLSSAEYRQKAEYEFALVKQLSVIGFPTVLIQESEDKFYLVSRGYADYNTVRNTVDKILHSIASSSSSPS